MKSGNCFGRVILVAVLCGMMILSGCSTDWVGQAQQIVAVMIPAATNVVALVAAVGGKDVSASDLDAIQKAGAQAGSDLQLVQSLILAYQKADDGAKPGILNQIQSGINAVQGNLQALLAALHIKDAATQAKVTAVVGIVLSEVQSLAAIVPIVKGDAQNSKAAFAAVKMAPSAGQGRAPLSANQFVASYNSTLTARTGNAGLDRMTAGLQIHLHGKVERIASAGALE